MTRFAWRLQLYGWGNGIGLAAVWAAAYLICTRALGFDHDSAVAGILLGQAMSNFVDLTKLRRQVAARGGGR